MFAEAGKKSTVQPSSLVGQYAFDDVNTGILKNTDTGAVDLIKWITARNNNPADAVIG